MKRIGEEYLKRASQGDNEAFSIIVSLNNDKVKKIASIYVGNHFEDIVQDVWLKIFAKRHLLANVLNFENWLFLVVRNTCFNYLGTEKKRKKFYNLSLHENISDIDNQVSYPDITDRIIRKESFEIVSTIIEDLSESYSLPFVMRHIKAMTLDEIAKTLNLPLSTVKWRIHAAKQQTTNKK